jgi:PD-(D/E)XK nuclease superfamily protein
MFDAPTPSNHPVDVGTRSEAAVMAALVRLGYRVLLPFGFNHRYDLVLDAGDRFVRAQVKTGRLCKGAIVFRGESIRSNTKVAVRRSYAGEVDIFLVYSPETDGVYVVPAEEVATIGTLRVNPPANNQQARVRWAADYKLRPASAAEEPETGLEPVQPDLQGRCSTS